MRFDVLCCVASCYIFLVTPVLSIYSRLFHGWDQCMGCDTEHGVGDPVLFESAAQLEGLGQKTGCVDRSYWLFWFYWFFSYCDRHKIFICVAFCSTFFLHYDTPHFYLYCLKCFFLSSFTLFLVPLSIFTLFLHPQPLKFLHNLHQHFRTHTLIRLRHPLIQPSSPSPVSR